MTVFELEESLMGAGAQAQVEVSLTLEGVTVELPIVTVRPFPRNVELVVSTESEAFQQLLWRAVDLEMEHSLDFEEAVAEAVHANTRKFRAIVREYLEAEATYRDALRSQDGTAGPERRYREALAALRRLAGEEQE